MKFVIEITNLENAAFTECEGAREYEVCRIIRKIADQIENGENCGRCMDINGNGVGIWAFTKEG